MTTDPNVSVVVIIPCRDEEFAVAKVVADFRSQLPGARIVVIDNASQDRTADIARAAGAEVIVERRPGKGNAVRRAFADLDGDVYLLVDGDDTYSAELASQMTEEICSGRADLVNARRRYVNQHGERRGHVLGNRALSGTVRRMFGSDVGDMLSGYKAFSRRLVKAMPITSTGFEIETEMTVHALALRVPITEVDAEYRERPLDSASKLRTFRDGRRILWMIGRMMLRERPLLTLGSLAGIIGVIAILVGLPVIAEYRTLGLVLKIPSAVLASALGLLAVLVTVAALVLDGTKSARYEVRYLTYLSIGPARGDRERA